MTLCQYYDSKAKEKGYKCWNTMCADYQIRALQHLKKLWKKEFKLLKHNSSKD